MSHFALYTVTQGTAHTKKGEFRSQLKAIHEFSILPFFL